MPSTNPTMGATSQDDLMTMAALGDEDAKKALAEQAQKLNKGTDPAQVTDRQTDSNWSIEHLAKAQAAGANPPAPPAKQTPEQAKADGGQQTPGNPVLSKADDDEQGDDESDDDYKERMEKKCKKSLDEVSPEEEALFKAMDIAEGIARGAMAEPDPDRRELLAKSYADGTLDDEGRVELFELLKSEMPADEDIQDLDDEPEASEDSLNKGFTDAALSDPAIDAGYTDEDGVDVSGYLARLSSFVGGSLDTINENLSKSLDRVHQYNLAASKANRALGAVVMRQEKMIKSLTAQNEVLGARVEHVEQQPQQRRTVPTARALEKSMTTPDGQPTDGLTRDQKIRGMNMLMEKSMQPGYGGEAGRSPSGRDITIDTAHYESCGQIHPDMLHDIKNVMGKH
jgi:hypothetical protein